LRSRRGQTLGRNWSASTPLEASSTARGAWPGGRAQGKTVSQPKLDLPPQSRLRSLARLEAETVKAEADYTR